MTNQIALPEDARDDLLERGHSRRQLSRVAGIFGAVAGAGAVAASLGRPAYASGSVWASRWRVRNPCDDDAL